MTLDLSSIVSSSQCIESQIIHSFICFLGISMTQLQPLLAFDPFDNPMHLSKVGNWVITFISPQDQVDNIQLAITYVLPRHISDELQARRIVISQTQDENRWRVEQIECYNSQLSSDQCIDLNSNLAQDILKALIGEFNKYDVSVEVISS